MDQGAGRGTSFLNPKGVTMMGWKGLAAELFVQLDKATVRIDQWLANIAQHIKANNQNSRKSLVILAILGIYGAQSLSGCGHYEVRPVQKLVAFDVPTVLLADTPLPRVPGSRLREIDPVLLWDAAEDALASCNADKGSVRRILESQQRFITNPTPQNRDRMLQDYFTRSTK